MGKFNSVKFELCTSKSSAYPPLTPFQVNSLETQLPPETQPEQSLNKNINEGITSIQTQEHK